jgi:hypothetical protein
MSAAATTANTTTAATCCCVCYYCYSSIVLKWYEVFFVRFVRALQLEDSIEVKLNKRHLFEMRSRCVLL